MTDMTFDRPDSVEFSLDRVIERLIGKQVRGELEDVEFARLQQLLVQRARLRRPNVGIRRRSSHAHAS